MTSLVTYDDYVRITGDEGTDQQTVEDTLDEMLELVNQELDRFLEQDTYTETLPTTHRGRVYPRGVPVTSLPASASYESSDEGYSLRNVPLNPVTGPFFDSDTVPVVWERGLFTTVTYTGGYTYETFPRKLRRLLCRLTAVAVNPGSAAGLLPGTTQATVGDVSVTLEAGSIGTSELDALLPGTCAALRGFVRPVY